MSAAGSSRVLRSGSKTRSEGSGAPRSIRGRSSRRGSPAAAASAPADDHDELPFSLQSYGTSGRSAELQLQSARIGKRQAVDPIVNAVSGAEASNVLTNNTPGGLAAVVEAEETNIDAVEASSRNHLPHFAETPDASFFSRFSNTLWAPRHPDPGSENPRNSIHQHQGRSNANNLTTNWAKYFMLALMTVMFGILGYNLPYIVSYVSDFKTYLPASAGSSELSNVTVHDWKQLKHRLDIVEQYLYNLPTSSSPPDSTTEHQINWFTPGFEPIIDVHLSSPTTTVCDPTWKPWPFSSMFWQKCPEMARSPPHKMAFQSWDDPTEDQWCAPKSGGKLQLAVQISRPILPTELVVEYMAMQASPKFYMTMAPKEVELWIRVRDDDVRAKLSDAIDKWHPELWENSSPQGKELHGVRELSEEYVPIGRWDYNIYAPQNVQGFSLVTPLLEYGVQTDKFVIRVNSNWGNMDYTCINRLRMHGVDTSGIIDYLEENPITMQG